MPLLPQVLLSIWSVQAPADTQPVAPDGPPPEAGVAPAEVESTPAVQRPQAETAPPEPIGASDARPQPEPSYAPDPVPEPAVAPDPTAAPTYTEPAQPPGVGTSQQDPNGASGGSSGPAYVPTDPDPGAKDKNQKREDRQNRRKRKPFLYNPLWLGVGLGASFFGGGRGALNVGADATYFFIPWVGAGADINNTFFFGAADDEVSNIFSFTPTVTLLPFPRARLSPYVRGGIGPVVYNKGAGTLGRWVAGGGVVSRFSRAFINIGVDVTGQLPDERYEELIGGPENCRITEDPCSLNIIPRIGIGIALGSRRR